MIKKTGHFLMVLWLAISEMRFSFDGDHFALSTCRNRSLIASISCAYRMAESKTESARPLPLPISSMAITIKSVKIVIDCSKSDEKSVFVPTAFISITSDRTDRLFRLLIDIVTP
ncbi:hypothetical protein [Collimonas sp. OK607]|uniref:hypothetical protein n=1 Tax=Collimonas sp. OK607 TaxID=1798194 RepID=UPI000B831842|nr:hypothetical protein [Collimonas sp. OK607]